MLSTGRPGRFASVFYPTREFHRPGQRQARKRIQSSKGTHQHSMPIQSLHCFRKIMPLPVLLFALAITPAVVASAQTVAARPCDLFASATPCVAAFSTTRALYRDYTGPLYQVTRKSDQRHTDIGLLAGGYADSGAQDKFCAGTTCTITRLYDQSPNHNDLTTAPPGGAARGPGPNGYDLPVAANALPVTVGGHKVYGISVFAGAGYRNDAPRGTAVHGQPEGVYMVTSALHLNDKCCFDFGNAEANNLDNKAGHMDAINIMCHRSPCRPDAGLDMEDGIYGHLKVPAGTAFVTDMGACDGQHTYAIYQGSAQSGALTSTGAIPLPNGYQPMRQEGAILLGTGGDNSNWATGYFFEGVMTLGMPTARAMEAVQRNIVAAGYAGRLAP
jgi:non-reducing end alpha-L-arabinofuranosidase